VNVERLWRLPEPPSLWTMISSFPSRRRYQMAKSPLHITWALTFMIFVCCPVCVQRDDVETFTANVTTESDYCNVLVKGMMMMVDRQATRRVDAVQQGRERECVCVLQSNARNGTSSGGKK
jgi:hypothetical protein